MTIPMQETQASSERKGDWVKKHVTYSLQKKEAKKLLRKTKKELKKAKKLQTMYEKVMEQYREQADLYLS